MKRAFVAEGVGSFFLFATVIGSGIMAEKLAGGNVAVALLGNTMATAAMLFVLITMLGPVSGAHFNPTVSLVMASWLGATYCLISLSKSVSESLAFGPRI
jgi:glycerol uptake facilitator-like aquaporin